MPVWLFAEIPALFYVGTVNVWAGQCCATYCSKVECCNKCAKCCKCEEQACCGAPLKPADFFDGTDNCCSCLISNRKQVQDTIRQRTMKDLRVGGGAGIL